MTTHNDLLAQLETAAAEGLAPNLTRFLSFLGWTEGETLELQALNVPADRAAGRWRDAPGMSAHGSTLATLERLASEADRFKAQGVYLLFNAIDPGVQHRRGPGAWHAVPKGEGTTDRDVTHRRALYIDLDPQRTRGVSATAAELLAAADRALAARELLARFIPAETIGAGRSGNGCALFVALVPVPPEGEGERLVKAALVALAGLLDDAAVKVDVSVSDPKRLCFLPGTVKRKGAHSTERPHRRAAFLGAETPRRLTADELRALVAGLRGELDNDEARAAVDAALAGAPAKVARPAAPRPAATTNGASTTRPSSATSASAGGTDDFRVANYEIPVVDVLSRFGLLDGDRPKCPGCGESDSGVAIVGNGLKCSHNRCSQKGHSAGFRTVVDLVMERTGCERPGALDWLRREFPGVIPERQKQPRRPPPTARTTPVDETRDDHQEDDACDSAAPLPPLDPWRYHTTDTGNGERMAAHHGADLRYCHPWQKWLVWDGRRWAEDDHAAVKRRAKQTALSIYDEARAIRGDDDRAQARRKALGTHAGKSEARDRREAMMYLAQSEPGIPVVPKSLDRHPWLLNVENGTLDLRTGELRPHRRDDLLTKLAPVVYDPAAEAPVFCAFLDTITGGDRELQTFLQRFFGYALTGEIREHVLVMAYGTGSNGKSTLLHAFMTLMGDYAYQAPADLIMAKKGETHPTDQAGLFGRRLAVCMETPEGRSMDEARMKALTGGDLVTARRMREDFWTFEPTHKLILATNHKPNIRTTDHGTWRRQKLIPFTVQIPSDKQDKGLPHKLRAEFPGLLRWAVEGCLAWQREDSLGEPAVVSAATSAWRNESDPLAAFLAAECELGDGFKAEASGLFAAYQRVVAAAEGEGSMTSQMFGRRLKERGLVNGKGSGGVRFWQGVRLLPVGRSRPIDSEWRMADSGGQFRHEPSSEDSLGDEPGTNRHYPPSATRQGSKSTMPPSRGTPDPTPPPSGVAAAPAANDPAPANTAVDTPAGANAAGADDLEFYE